MRTPLRVLLMLVLVLVVMPTASSPFGQPLTYAYGDQSAMLLDEGDPPFNRIPGDTVVESAEVGTLPGNWSVTADGASTYTIPLWVPDGRAGLQPSLALVYNSRAGNGLLGMGWSLQGLSMITRCPKSLAVDGIVEGINFRDGASGDRFCMDGRRLIAVKGETGEAGSEYRHERDRFAKIILHNEANDAASFFEVRLRNGQILHYGNSSRGEAATLRPTVYQANIDGNLTADKRVNYAWRLKRIEDRSGNYIEFSYESESHTASEGPFAQGGFESWPVEIRYTGYNGDAGTRSIRFEYKTNRDDAISRFVSGVQLRTTRLLKAILIYGPNADHEEELVRAYKLKYEQNPVTQRSILTELMTCDAFRPRRCMPPTTFTWQRGAAGSAQDGSNAWTLVDTGISEPTEDWLYEVADEEARIPVPAYTPMDVDGDTDDDLLFWQIEPHEVVGITTWWLLKNNGHTFVGPTKAGLPNTHGTLAVLFGPKYPLDYNHDGRDDVISVDQPEDPTGSDEVRLNLYRSTVDELELEETDLMGCHSSRALFALGDLDGNGLADFLGGCQPFDSDKVEWSHRLNADAYGNYEPVTSGMLRQDAEDVRERVIDYDGDGKYEFLAEVRGRNTYQLVASDRKQESTNLKPDDPTTPYDDHLFLDINGDGLQDVLTLSGTGGIPQLRLNTGWGFGPSYEAEPDTSREFSNARIANVRIVDLNADGRDDVAVLIERETATNFIYALKSDGVRLRPWGIRDANGRSLPAGTPWGPDFYEGWHTTQPLDFNGDAMTDFLVVDDGVLKILRNDLQHPDLLQTVQNGLGHGTIPGHGTTFNYAPLEDRSVYSPGESCTYPRRCAYGGMVVVREVSVDNPGHKQNHQYQYTYEDGVFDLRGRGWLGFGRRTVTHKAGGATYRTTTTTYNNRSRWASEDVYPEAGLPATRRTTTRLNTSGELHIEHTNYTYDIEWHNAKRTYHSVRLDKTETRTYEVPRDFGHLDDETPLYSSTTTYSYGPYGFIDWMLHRKSAGGPLNSNNLNAYYVRTDYEREHHPDEYILGLPRQITVESGFIGTTEKKKRAITLDYYPDTVLVRSRTVVPDHSDLRLDTIYQRNEHGVTEGIIRRSRDGEERTTEIEYGPDGIYPRRIENALGHVRWIGFHPSLGVPAIAVDANGYMQTWRYDGFGRLKEQHGEDGSERFFEYSAGGVTDFGIKSYGTAPESYLGFDVAGRIVQRWEGTLRGNYAVEQFTYDVLGRLASVTRPAFLEDTWGPRILYEYDQLDRITKVIYPDGGSATWRYDDYRTTFKNPLGHESYTITDKNGFITKKATIDPGGMETAINYNYGPFGELESITDEAGSEWLFNYDARGHRTLLNDPDAGERHDKFNAFGELVQQTDAAGKVTVIQRDLLGRPYRIESETDGVTTLDWVDVGSPGVGQLDSATSPWGATIDHSYDTLGRLENTTWTVRGDTYTVGYSYDDVGRLEKIQYPDGTDSFAVRYSYNRYGHLESLLWDGPDELLWEIHSTTADGSPREVFFGNEATTVRQYDDATGRMTGVVATGAGGSLAQSISYDEYDLNGNLKKKTDHISGMVSTYEYDHLDRLTRWQPNAGTGRLDYDYDEVGNLTLKEGETQEFGTNGAGLHQISETAAGKYEYDPNGRRTEGPGMGVQQYTSFDLPLQMKVDGRPVTMEYDAFQRRVSRVTPDSATIYIGGLYEKRTNAHGETTHVYRLIAPTGEVAQRMTDDGGESLHFLHLDRLGSLRAITDETGKTVARFRYDPFGARTTEMGDGSDVRLGFTGHRHDMGHINMKGRIYDSATGSFFTADPIVGSLFDRRQLNRYSYGLNNPVRYIDPTGLGPPCDGPCPFGNGGFAGDAPKGPLGLHKWSPYPKPSSDMGKIKPTPQTHDSQGRSPADVDLVSLSGGIPQVVPDVSQILRDANIPLWFPKFYGLLERRAEMVSQWALTWEDWQRFQDNPTTIDRLLSNLQSGIQGNARERVLKKIFGKAWAGVVDNSLTVLNEAERANETIKMLRWGDPSLRLSAYVAKAEYRQQQVFLFLLQEVSLRLSGLDQWNSVAQATFMKLTDWSLKFEDVRPDIRRVQREAIEAMERRGIYTGPTIKKADP